MLIIVLSVDGFKRLIQKGRKREADIVMHITLLSLNREGDDEF